MPGRRRKCVVKDGNYDVVLAEARKDLERLESDYKSSVEVFKKKIKDKKLEIKKLEQEKEKYDTMTAEKKKQEEMQVIVQMIEESGKSLDEIKELFLK